MEHPNHDRVTKGLRILHQSLGTYAEQELKQTCGNQWWDIAVLHALTDLQKKDVQKKTNKGQKPSIELLDIAALLKVTDENWHRTFSKTLSRQERTWIKELRDTRNKWAHAGPKDMKADDAWRALDTMARVVEGFDHDATVQLRELAGAIREEQVKAMMAATEASQPPKRPDAEPSTSGLLPWREVVTPHHDVAQGRYRQAEFAADLAQVHAGKAGSEYQDPIDFFSRTFLTEGLQQTLSASLARVNELGGEPVVQLKTAFGGGKTHTMLALYHLLAGTAPLEKLSGVKPLVESVGLSSLRPCKVAVLVGTDISPGKARGSKFLKQGRRVHTLWGDLAAQLGGDDAYELFAQEDKKGIAPGSSDIADLLDRYGPCLILIDELIAYTRQIYGKEGLPAGTFDSNLTFVQNLTEGVKRSKASLLVASIPESEIEVGGEGGVAALERIEKTFARVEAIWKPVGSREGFEIVRRRLFNPLPKEHEASRDKVIDAFLELYKENASDFPGECREADYRSRMASAYPIHPEVFGRLYEQWGTLEKFQRTRGVLRLMATTIHQLWHTGDRSLLVMPGSLPLNVPIVRDELTRHLTDAWNSVVDTDIDGDRSKPYELDRNNGRFGRLQACRRISRTVFLGSAPSAKGQHLRGIEDVRVRLGCVQPEESIPVFNDALGKMRDELTHLYESSGRYWYDLPPNLRRTVEDKARRYDEHDVLAELRRRLQTRERGEFKGIHIDKPSSDIPDEKAVRLVVLGPHQVHKQGEKDSAAIQAAQEILENRGQSPRQYRNTLVFVAPDRGERTPLEQETRRYLAWKEVLAEEEALNLDAHQRKQAKENTKRTDETVDLRLHATYCWLLVPVQEGTNPLDWEASRIGGDQSYVQKASNALRENRQIVGKWSGALLKMELDRWLWKDHPHINTHQLWEQLASYCYLPRLRDETVLLGALQDGLETQDTFGYAASVDDDGRYQALRLGTSRGTVHIDTASVLVKPDVARKQLDDDAAKAAASAGAAATSGAIAGTTPTPVSGGPAPAGGTTTGPGPAPGPDPAKPEFRRFYGRVTLDPNKVSSQAGTIAQEVIAHLSAQLGSKVTVSLEIEAALEDPAPNDLVRTITENCRTLDFADSDFES